jgi:hypothetical protein
MQHCVIFNALKEYCIPKEEEELYLQHICICVEQIPKMGSTPETLWILNAFKEWQRSRNETAKYSPDISPIFVDIDDMTKDELNYSISRFICEATTVDGSEYPSETIHSFVICLQLYLDTIGRNYKFLNDDAFSQIKNTGQCDEN